MLSCSCPHSQRVVSSKQHCALLLLQTSGLWTQLPASSGRHSMVGVASNSISVIQVRCSDTCLHPTPPPPTHKHTPHPSPIPSIISQSFHSSSTTHASPAHTPISGGSHWSILCRVQMWLFLKCSGMLLCSLDIDIDILWVSVIARILPLTSFYAAQVKKLEKNCSYEICLKIMNNSNVNNYGVPKTWQGKLRMHSMSLLNPSMSCIMELLTNRKQREHYCKWWGSPNIKQRPIRNVLLMFRTTRKCTLFSHAGLWLGM